MDLRRPHGCTHGRVEVLFADQIEDAGLVQMVARRAMETREDERDGFLTQRLDQLGQHTHAGRVYMVKRLCVEYQPVYGRGRARDSLANTALDIVGVREEQPIIEPVDQYSGTIWPTDGAGRRRSGPFARPNRVPHRAELRCGGPHRRPRGQRPAATREAHQQ